LLPEDSHILLFEELIIEVFVLPGEHAPVKALHGALPAFHGHFAYHRTVLFELSYDFCGGFGVPVSEEDNFVVYNPHIESHTLKPAKPPANLRENTKIQRGDESMAG